VEKRPSDRVVADGNWVADACKGDDEMTMKRSGFLNRFRRFSRNKFGAKPVHDMLTGETFDSTGESRRYGVLQLKQKAGMISELVLHPKVVLVQRSIYCNAPEIAWKLDYSYRQDGRTIWEDYKPRPMTAVDRLKIKLWAHFGPGVLHITDAKGNVTKCVDVGSMV
jgi:hypothetical protein